MKRFILAIILTLAFCTNCFALNLRPYMQTPPEVQVFAKRVITDGGKVVDLEYCQKYTRLSKQLLTWSNGKFVGDANMGVKLNSGVSVQTLYDLSGNNNDAVQATADNQPVWTANVQGGRAGLVFDGTDDWMTIPNIAETGFTIIFSASVTVSSGNLQMLLDSSAGAPSTANKGFWIGLEDRGSTNPVDTFTCSFYVPVGTPTDKADQWYKTSSYTSKAWKIITLAGSSDTDQVYALNGGLQTPYDTRLNGTGAHEGSALSWGLGSLNDGASFHTAMSLGSTSVFTSVLTTAQRTALETFIGHSYYSIY